MWDISYNLGMISDKRRIGQRLNNLADVLVTIASFIISYQFRNSLDHTGFFWRYWRIGPLRILRLIYVNCSDCLADPPQLSWALFQRSIQ